MFEVFDSDTGEIFCVANTKQRANQICWALNGLHILNPDEKFGGKFHWRSINNEKE